jgi:hypothetical protein
MFLLFVTSAVLLFLVCASALPDDFGDEPIDLRAYYAATSRRFWLLFLAHWAATTGSVIWAWITVSHGQLNLIHPIWLTMPVALPLLFTRSRWWHGAGLVALAVLFVAPHLGQTLAHGGVR